jgi:hypothetical protein
MGWYCGVVVVNLVREMAKLRTSCGLLVRIYGGRCRDNTIPSYFKALLPESEKADGKLVDDGG